MANLSVMTTDGSIKTIELDGLSNYVPQKGEVIMFDGRVEDYSFEISGSDIILTLPNGEELVLSNMADMLAEQDEENPTKLTIASGDEGDVLVLDNYGTLTEIMEAAAAGDEGSEAESSRAFIQGDLFDETEGDSTTGTSAAATEETAGETERRGFAPTFVQETNNSDTVDPSAPTIDLTSVTDTGDSDTDNITNDNTPTITGTSEPATLITLTINETQYTTTTAADGTWTITLDETPDGTYNISATATDESNNVSATSTMTITIDTVGEGTVSVNPITDDDLINASEANETIPVTGTVSGEFAEGDTVAFNVNGTDYTATVKADGTWSSDVAGSDLAAQTEFTVTATGTDVAGNTINATADSEHGLSASITLSATNVDESTGSVVTATLDVAPLSTVRITLDSGEVIRIRGGETTGSVTLSPQGEDIYSDSGTSTVSVSSVSGGGYTNVDLSNATTTYDITDTVDTTTVSLSATSDITEAGGTVTYTAELTNPAETDVTVTLSNGETITIEAGETTGTVDVTVEADEDVYSDASTISANITGATGGNFENLEVDNTAAVTNINDTVDTTTVSLSATSDITEAGGTVTYTAELTNPAETDVTVTLSNGETITIEAGETTGTVDVTVEADEDVYSDASTISANITGATGGNFENLEVDNTAAVTNINDTVDTTTVSLSATSDITEAGGTVTYTAELTNPAETDVTVTLSNGETITIEAGETTGTVDVTVEADEDVYSDASTISANITGATGGNFENLEVDNTAAVTNINDTVDTTTVSLSATSDITEAGGTVTYTAELTNPAETDVTVTLSNGETITIEAGETTGTVDVTVEADEDVYSDASTISANITGATGGNFENLEVDNTAAVTNINDTVDTTTVSLSATSDITEAGGTVTYTAELTNPAETDVTVTLSNGETITIEAGETTGTVDVTVEADEDVYSDASTISANITGATGGNFENLEVDNTAAVTNINDTVDTTTVSLSATSDITEAGGTVTYTAELTNPAETDVTVTLSNGETITIEAGETTGTVDVTVEADEDVYSDASTISANITGATGGNFENLEVDNTAAVTNINDTVDTTTVSLSATSDITEAGGTVTYTAELTNPAETDVTVTLSNGETITIEAGETTGTVDVTVEADEDVYSDASTISANITGATGGNFENLEVDNTAAVTNINDTVDTTTVSLSATSDITEAGGTVTYTAELTNPAETDVTVTLSNGETITIEAGETTGTVDVTVEADEDVYSDASTISANITGATGGNFENLEVDNTAAVTNINDTVDTTTVSLSATSDITEAGGTVTYTAELTNPAETDVTVTLSNGETITIEAGETTGTVDVTVEADEDVYSDASTISANITGATGGNFENLEVDNTAAVTNINDTVDTTTVSLSATSDITEAGGTVTYTAELTNPAETDVTVTLSNGETITIEAGETTGTVDVTVEADEDVYSDASTISANITGATGGNFENLEVDNTAAVTNINDTVDTTTVSLSATSDITEAGGTVTYTAELTNPAETDVTVTLSNGETITIEAGETTGTVDVTVEADEDVYSDASTISANITGATGGNFENLEVDNTAAVTNINDTVDTTTVSLSATSDITEAGGTVTYTAELTNPAETDVTVTLSNGETITIEAGETTGTVDVTVEADEDVYSDASTISANITGATGGNFENLEVDNTAAVTNINDTVDTTTVSLSATSDITEAGGTVTYTAELTNPAETDVTVTLSNGETITIEAGETTGTVDVTVEADEDVYSDASTISANITGATGGNFENLEVDNTAAVTNINDTVDTTTVSLSATSDITEAGGTVTYTAELTNPAETDVTVTLSNGETITIEAGETTGTVDVTVEADEDVYSDASTISANITGATGGNFENLEVDNTAAVTNINDTVDTTTVSLSATSDITEAGGTVTYTAELTNPAETDVTVTLSNGETITIEAGETTGTVDVTVEADEDVYSDASTISANITGATGGNFENLEVDNTAAVTNINDTVDTTTVSLSATSDITEAGGTVTYTAELTNPAETDVTVTLSNGETITIEAGETTGTVDVTVEADEDVYSDASTISANITGATGGNFENLEVDNTAAVTNINDTVDTTTVSLSATSDITEAGGTVTYTAELTNPAETDVTVTLSNGETITIEAGETTGTVDVTVEADEDVYSDASTISANITGATGGNFENLEVDNTAAVTNINDTVDTTTVSLSATSDITEAGGTVTYTAELTNPAETDVTVTLSNGETITIEAGETTGTVDVTVEADEDVYSDASTISANITGATGGNFENLEVDNTAAVTNINDTVDTTTVSLSATSDITEAGGTVTYTAELTNPAETDVTVTLSNGETITIEAGETTGTVDVTVEADEDVYSDASTISANITGATGGNFENLEVDNTAAVTNINDTVDTTTVSLSATSDITEAGGTVTYTAELTNPAETDVTVTLSNGETITIEAGETTGTVDVTVEADEDVYSDASTISANITGATGGNFENLEVDNTAAVTNINDTVDTTTVSLSATSDITEAGGTVTYTAELTNPAETDVTVTLSNGETITIEAGETTGTVDVTVEADEDVYSDASTISANITGATGGNFENLEVDNTAAVTNINDTVDTTTVSLSATSDITEAGGTVTYTAELTNPAETDVTVTLSNGETITIEAGETTGTVDVTVEADEDVYSDASTISANITGATGGNFENLEVDNTAAVTNINDTVDTTTVSLSATSDITEAGGTVTYTAELTNPAETDVTVTLSNGETITIEAGETTGTVDVTVEADEDVYSDASTISANITGATGGNFENLEVDNTAAVTNINDTVDTTTVSLSATSDITEAGGTVTYTAELTNPAETDVTVTLSNGETITIEAGETTGTVDVTVEADEDVYSDASTISANITGATGGNFENLEVDNTAAVTNINDTVDTTTVSISGDTDVIEGGTATYTISVDNAPQGTPLTLTLVVGHITTEAGDITPVTEEVTIPVGETSITYTVTNIDDSIYNEGDETYSVTISDASGGNYENLVIGDSSVITTIEENDIDISASATIELTENITSDDIINATEAGGDVTITGTVGGDAAAGDTVTVTVNGEEYTTTVDADGTSFSVDVAGSDLVADDDNTIEAKVVGTDEHGNGFEATDTETYSVDTEGVGTVTVDNITADDIINESEADGTVTVTGSVGGELTQGDTVTFTVNDTQYTATVDENGNWSADVAGSDLAADTDFTVTATGTDVAGNAITATADSTHAVDTSVTPPTVVITEDVNNDGILSSSEIEGVTNISIGLPNDAVAGDTLNVTINGETIEVNITEQMVTNGGFDTDVSAPANGETLTVSATITDQAGNTSESSSDSVTVDSVAEATDDTATTDEDSSVTINVLSNDEDGSTITSVDTPTNSSGEALGTVEIVTVDGTQQIKFTPADNYDELMAGESENVTFNYQTEDANGNAAEATVTVTVEGVSNDLTYVSESASYQNVVGYYEIDENGDPVSPASVVIDDQNGMTSGEHLADLDPDKEYGFFIIANGANEVDENSVITFDTSGDTPTLLIDGNEPSKPVYHDTPQWNEDGKDHFVFTQEDDGGMKIEIEDLPNLGDNDFNDVVLHSDIVLPDKIIENEAPQTTDDSVSTLEDTALTLSVNDFGDYSDADGDALSSVQIVSLPVVGVITLNGVEVEAGDEISVADINSGALVFTPADDSDTNVSFDFKVSDGTSFSDTATTTINVEADADTPINVSIEVEATGNISYSNENMVVNGSFEDTTTNATQVTGSETLTAGSGGWTGLSEMNGWTLITDEGADAPVMEVHDAGHAGVGATDGTNYMDFGETNYSGDSDNDNTQIGQVIDAVDGVTYSMSFDFVDKASMQEGGTSGENSGVLEVYWGGDLVATVDGNNSNWQTETLDLVGGAGDGSNMLSFKEVGEGGDNWGMAIDNIYMAPTENMIEYDVDVSAMLADTDGSESLSITLSGLPSGATLEVGEAGDVEGTWIIPADGNSIDLENVKMHIPESADTFEITATATATDSNGDTATASATDTVEDVNIDNNTAATSTDDSVTATEDTTLVLTTNDFGTYSDSDGDAFSAVQITSIPENGTLKLLGQDGEVIIEAGDEVNVSDIEIGNLVFVPAANSDVTQSFDFRVSDGNEFSTESYTTTININAVADAPTITLDIGDPVQSTVTTGEDIEPIEGATQSVTSDISITNASFESSSHHDGHHDWTVNGWSQDSGDSGDWDVRTSGHHAHYDSGEVDGDNVAFIADRGTISQTLSETLSDDTTYNFSIDIGHSNQGWGQSSDYSVNLYAGDQLIGTITEDDVTEVAGEMVTANITVDTSTLPDNFSGFGQSLKIQINNHDNNDELHFDNLVMTKTVDEVTGDEWAGSGVSESNDELTITKDSTGTKSFDFGVENAGKTVTLSFDYETTNWESSGSAKDYLNVSVNGSTDNFVDSNWEGDTGNTITGTYTTTAVVGPDGTVSVSINPNTTGGSESVTITDFDISAEAQTETINTYPIDIEATLGVDTDGSESLGNVSLSGIPSGATLYADGVEVTVTNGSAEFTQDQVEAGNITMTLSASENQNFELEASVTSTESSNGSTATATANDENVVVDDAPETTDETINIDIENGTTASQDTNIVMVLDLSGSMNWDGDQDTSGTQSRLQIAKEAIEEMIEAYDGLGDVNVQLTTFSSQGTVSSWMSADDAIDTINNLSASGWTNYEDAVYETYNNYSEPAADKTVGFFISDGEPTKENTEGRDVRGNIGQDAESGWIDSDYRESWTEFVNENLDELNVIGIGDGITNTTYLDQLAEGMNSTVTVNTMHIVDVTQLGENITPNVNVVEGTLSDNIDYGNDGKGGINSIVVGGVTYAASNASDVADLEAGITTPEGGKLTFDFDTGDYTYSTVSTVASDYNETFTVTVSDADGDTATLDLNVNVDVDETVTDQVITVQRDVDDGDEDGDYNGNITTGDGNDTITIGDDIADGRSVSTGMGNDTVTIGDDIKEGSSLDTGSGNDTVTIGDDIRDGSTIDLGSGDDTLTINGDSIDGTIKGGEGTDTLILNDVTLEEWNAGVKDNFTGFENVTLKDGVTLDMTDTEVSAPTLSMDISDATVTTTSSSSGSGIEIDAVDQIASLGDVVTDATESYSGDANSYISGDNDADRVEIGDDAKSSINLQGGDNQLEIGGEAKNSITVGNDDDTIKIGDNAQSINLGEGDNQLEIGGDAKNSIQSGAGTDTINIEGSSQYISTGAGDDLVNIGNDANSSINLGEGDNQLEIGGDAKNSITTGTGDDLIRVDGDSQAITTSDGDDQIKVGGNANNSIQTGTGADTVVIDGNAQYVSLGDGADKLDIGGDAKNSIQAGAGDDQIRVGGDTNSSVNLGDGDNQLQVGGDSKNSIQGSGGDDIVRVGGTASNNIQLGDGDNQIQVGGDANYISTGTGADEIKIGGDAKSSISSGDGSDTINIGGTAKNSITLGGGDDEVSIGGDANSSINAGSGNDTINIGGDAKNSIQLGEGNDQLSISGDAQYINAGSGNDTITIGGDAKNSISLGEGDDVLKIDGDVKNTIDGGSGNDTLYLNVSRAEYNDDSNLQNKIRNFETIIFNDDPEYQNVSVDQATQLDDIADLTWGGSSSSTTTYSYDITLNSGLSDTDGSESLSAITLSNLPDGVTLKDSNGAEISANDDGSYTVNTDSNGDATVSIESDSEVSQDALNDITSKVTSTEDNGGDSLTLATDGEGYETLFIEDDMTFDFDSLAQSQADSLDAIDMSNSSSTLEGLDVDDFITHETNSDDEQIMKIIGESDDEVKLNIEGDDATWTKTDDTVTDDEGNEFDVYQGGDDSVKLYIDTDVVVTDI